MNAIARDNDTIKYIRCVENSKKVRWDIDRDVIRGRQFDSSRKYLPDGLTLLRGMNLTNAEKRFASQIQGRTYANIFGLVERFITTKLLEVGAEHALGNQHALEALVRFSDEEIKHQELFRRIEVMIAETMPRGYRFEIDPDDVARALLQHSTWSVLMLTLHIELFVQLHYRESIDPDQDLSELFKDVFLYHWKDECQHSVLDELELKRHDATLTPEQRDRGVDDFIRLVSAVDGILQLQAKADAEYFASGCGRKLSDEDAKQVGACFLRAYRWQYILSGAAHPRFQKTLGAMINEPQMRRIEEAVTALV